MNNSIDGTWTGVVEGVGTLGMIALSYNFRSEGQTVFGELNTEFGMTAIENGRIDDEGRFHFDINIPLPWNCTIHNEAVNDGNDSLRVLETFSNSPIEIVLILNRLGD